MTELTDFEREIADIMWPFCDVDALLEYKESRDITKREAAKVLNLAKKELMKRAISGEVMKSIDGSLHVKSEAINTDDKWGDKVQVIILKKDELH